MTSARIHDVPVAPRHDPIGRKPATQLLEPLDPLVAAGRPAALEQHHERRRVRVEPRDEVGAKLLDDRCLDVVVEVEIVEEARRLEDRKSTRLNSSHQIISYAVFCLKKKKNNDLPTANEMYLPI